MSNRFDLAQVPATVKLHGVECRVVAAVFVPGGEGTLSAHIVAYDNQRNGFNVHYLVHDDDAQTSYLHQGSYDLPYVDAIREVFRRAEGESSLRRP